ncbi:hypothetical protein POJ06DRAFT_258572 [Lipomyces tetrasporus]|uniref:Hydrogen voltage-gated channel 1 n=1 Tax=Lipomyces tetrasporus TaxID=54092 RepID=A0AAD7QQT7_9ASCO|nr:uncharacterized protein POJ06DRAFT_258572 [Lipomyces tetrasporus]KAJ8098117.1 hypothetical protein POJ06DRAFT_258572 [Lipomyces tetrasporus]
MSSSTSSLLGDRRVKARPGYSIVDFQQRLKKRLRHFLDSRAAHITIITLVAVETLLVIAELYIELFACEEPEMYGFLEEALPVISSLSLAISTMFMVELISCVYAFGLLYFAGKGRWLRMLDAVVIIASFVIDILEQGTALEGAELIVVLRFWRIAKIAEHIGSETKEEMEELKEDNHMLRLRVMELDRMLGTKNSDDYLVDQGRTFDPQDV